MSVSIEQLDSDKQAEVKALECALRILGMRAHSRAEMRKKLLLRGFSVQVVDSVVERVVHMGYLDDLQFAQDYVRLRGQSLGVGRLKSDLTAKGVSHEIQLQVLEAENDTDNDNECAEWGKAVRLAQRKLELTAHLPRETRVRRTMGLLVRRGFSTGLSTRVIRTILAEESSTARDESDL